MNHVFLIDPANSLTLERQAVGRCHRIGQGREVHVTKFVASDTTDDVLHQAAERLADAADGPAFVVRGHGGVRPRHEAEDVRHGASLVSRAGVLRHLGVTQEDLSAAGRAA